MQPERPITHTHFGAYIRHVERPILFCVEYLFEPQHDRNARSTGTIAFLGLRIGQAGYHRPYQFLIPGFRHFWMRKYIWSGGREITGGSVQRL